MGARHSRASNEGPYRASFRGLQFTYCGYTATATAVRTRRTPTPNPREIRYTAPSNNSRVSPTFGKHSRDPSQFANFLDPALAPAEEGRGPVINYLGVRFGPRASVPDLRGRRFHVVQVCEAEGLITLFERNAREPLRVLEFAALPNDVFQRVKLAPEDRHPEVRRTISTLSAMGRKETQMLLSMHPVSV